VLNCLSVESFRCLVVEVEVLVKTEGKSREFH